MAYQLPIKYFNSFWLKKVVGDSQTDPKESIEAANGVYQEESTITTWVRAGYNQGKYMLPTWPGLPWGGDLSQENPEDTNVLKNYPCYPFGGRNWNSYTGGTLPSCGGSLINRFGGAEIGREKNWFVEEARIRGGFNNTTVDFGVKAYLVEDENLQQNRFNTLIHSGIYNSRTGINNTNVFSTAEGSITKSLEPSNGSIQKLYAYNTNLTIFQENKISKALIDKDAIYSAEGAGTPVSSLKVVIGQIVPYKGEYGISTNPESWSQYGFRQYFADRYRSAILRLSNDGVTEISSYGMTDYFRDSLSLVSSTQTSNLITFDLTPIANDTVIAIEVDKLQCPCESINIGSTINANGVTPENLFVVDVLPQINNDKCTVTLSRRFGYTDFAAAQWPTDVTFISYTNDSIVGAFDNYNKSYNVSIKTNVQSSNCATAPSFSTLNFDEQNNGWVSFFSFNPVFMGSVKNNFYSSNRNSVYLHYSGDANNHGNFYGEYQTSNIEFIFNAKPSLVKNFQTISYEGSNGWFVESFISDKTEQLLNNGNWNSFEDSTTSVASYENGRYINPNTQMPEYSGFNLKENRYVANLVNNTDFYNDEVLNGPSMSGIKGYYATVKMTIDSTTNVGAFKELYAATTKWVVSSQ